LSSFVVAHGFGSVEHYGYNMTGFRIYIAHVKTRMPISNTTATWLYLLLLWKALTGFEARTLVVISTLGIPTRSPPLDLLAVTLDPIKSLVFVVFLH
jgi:hypothetical protein